MSYLAESIEDKGMTDLDTAEPVNGGAPPNDTDAVSDTTNGSSDPGAEKRARRMGWIPEEEFDDTSMVNRPRKFLSAETYIEKVESDLPILRERNRFLDVTVNKLEGRISESTGQIKSLNESVSELTELVDSLHDQNIEVGKRAYERGRRNAEAKMEEAVVEADPEKYRQAKSELDNLERHKPVDPPERRQQPEGAGDVTQPGQQQLTPAAQQFIRENSWFETSTKLRNAVIGIHDEVIQEMAGQPEYKQLAESKRRLQEAFPNDFEDYKPQPKTNPRRDAPAAVAGASAPEPRSKKQSFDSLPADVKKTYDRLAAHWKRKGKTYSKEQYVKNYHLNLEESRQ